MACRQPVQPVHRLHTCLASVWLRNASAWTRTFLAALCGVALFALRTCGLRWRFRLSFHAHAAPVRFILYQLDRCLYHLPHTATPRCLPCRHHRPCHHHPHQRTTTTAGTTPPPRRRRMDGSIGDVDRCATFRGLRFSGCQAFSTIGRTACIPFNGSLTGVALDMRVLRWTGDAQPQHNRWLYGTAGRLDAPPLSAVLPVHRTATAAWARSDISSTAINHQYEHEERRFSQCSWQDGLMRDMGSPCLPYARMRRYSIASCASG
jgi:hypothetical protein